MIKNKRGLSVMVSYILLISFALIMAVIVFAYLKTYVPKSVVSCPDDTSLFIKDFNCSNGELNITLKNNGRFSIGGYFIHSANDSTQEIATDNMVDLLNPAGQNQTKYLSSVAFSTSTENVLKPGEEVTNSYILADSISFIEIIPARFQTEKNRLRLVSCGGSVSKEVVSCTP
ncbi:hypothetical protein B6U91_00280 [Candidatus Pacearchaeota archaeon ex4484_71]|nr:MAG: hypothetical protein B6U91_00280 [Candidatus Pacearchaeota archaeon ex4484_71]